MVEPPESSQLRSSCNQPNRLVNDSYYLGGIKRIQATQFRALWRDSLSEVFIQMNSYATCFNYLLLWLYQSYPKHRVLPSHSLLTQDMENWWHMYYIMYTSKRHVGLFYVMWTPYIHCIGIVLEQRPCGRTLIIEFSHTSNIHYCWYTVVPGVYDMAWNWTWTTEKGTLEKELTCSH